MDRRKIYFLSGFILMVAAFFSAGYLHPDEHFQIIEFAALKLQLNEAINLPWEFHSQMRPAIQPAMVVLIYRLIGLLATPDPFFVAFILRLLTGCISFLAMWMIYKAYEKEFSNEELKKWFLILSFFLWFIIFINVRFTSETWSGNVFLIAFSYLKIKKPQIRLHHYFLTGVLLGLSFLFRYQSGLLILGLGLWLLFIARESVSKLLIMCSGIFLVFILGLFIDRWFYGVWTITAWNYLLQNILMDKVSGFGIQPWYFYFSSTFWEGIPPFSLVYIAAVLLFFIFRKRDILSWTLIPFLLIHFIIGHKEMRFIFPILGFMPYIIVWAIGFVKKKWIPRLLDIKGVKYSLYVFWITNLIMVIIVTVTPVDNENGIFQKIYRDYPTPTTLYFIKEDPYHRALDINFYKRQNLITAKVDSFEQVNLVPGYTSLLVVLMNPETPGLRYKRKLIYTSFPDWLKFFNFNHWIERTRFWYVYEIVE